jgi:hypothetical protein
MEVANRAKLYIPNDYDPYQIAGEEPGKCVLEYDAKRQLLILVSAETGETLDVMNPDDIIGAAVEVELLGPAGELRANSKHFQNKQEPMPSTPEDCGIFQSLAEDTDKLFSVSRNSASANPTNDNDNEPTSEIPFDTQRIRKTFRSIQAGKSFRTASTISNRSRRRFFRHFHFGEGHSSVSGSAQCGQPSLDNCQSLFGKQTGNTSLREKPRTDLGSSWL